MFCCSPRTSNFSIKSWNHSTERNPSARQFQEDEEEEEENMQAILLSNNFSHLIKYHLSIHEMWAFIKWYTANINKWCRAYAQIIP